MDKPENNHEPDLESLKALSRELAEAGALRWVIETPGKTGPAGLAFVLRNLSKESLDSILTKVDLALPLSADGLETLTALKKLVAQNKSLVKESITDELTGLFNFRHFKEMLDLELERVRRTDRPCSLMMIDLDGFKPVNDNFGHQKGNEILKRVAEIILKKIRSIDSAVRYGGDEFAVILPYTSATQGLKLADRIRQALVDDPLTGRYNVTGSFGLASYHFLDRIKEDEMVDHADKAMYQAKQEGGNRVHVWESDREREAPTQVSIDEKQALFGKRD